MLGQRRQSIIPLIQQTKQIIRRFIRTGLLSGTIFILQSLGGKPRMKRRKSNSRKKPANVPARREIDSGRREIAVAAASFHHSGPIPDPMTLERYDSLLPGAADRIIRMAEEQSAHRKEMEKIVVKSRTRDSLLGIISGFILALATIASGTYVIVQGHTWSGTILVKNVNQKPSRVNSLPGFLCTLYCELSSLIASPSASVESTR